jgi:RHS repeat-associated protein
VLGRLITDSVQVASGNPQNVDTTVQSLVYSYNTLGLPYQQTSYSSPLGSGSVVNQVTDGYNGFGQLTSQIQNLGGSPTISGTVNYIYSETNNGTENNSRLQATVYPDNRVVDDDYSPQQSPISSITHSGTTATATTASANGLSAGQTVTISGATPTAYDGTFTIASIVSSTQFTYTMSSTPSSNAGGYMMVTAQSLDNTISRADGLQDHSTGTVLDAYSYLGLSTVVQEAHPQTGIDLTYIDQSGVNDPTTNSPGGDQYTGLDQFGRVDAQYYTNLSTPSSPTDDFEYAYDQDSNPLYKNIVNQETTAATFSQLYHSNGASESSAYDSLNRLTSFAQGTLSASGANSGQLDTVSSATTTQSWSLDALGNWSSVTTNGTAQTRSVNSQNELTAVSSATTPTYDHNGNMTKDQNGNTYTYDAWNRMASETSGSTTMDLGYLAGGQRASIAFSGSTANYSFFNSAWQEIETESNTGPTGSTVVQDTYVWGLSNINELVARDDGFGNRIYVEQDANWNVTALVGKVSGTWQVVERFSYTPYGVATVLTGSWGSTTDAYSWIYRYQTGKYDSISGLYNFRNRDYSPTLGQWLEADPAGYVKGANLYEANLGAPISHVDPYGLEPGSGSEAGNNTGPKEAGEPPSTGPGTQPTPPAVPPPPPTLPPGWHYGWDPIFGPNTPIIDDPPPPPAREPWPWEQIPPTPPLPPLSPLPPLPPGWNPPSPGFPLGGGWYLNGPPYELQFPGGPGQPWFGIGVGSPGQYNVNIGGSWWNTIGWGAQFNF